MSLLEEMRAEYPARAEYVEKLIAWCRIEPGFERAAVAAEAVRMIVQVGDDEWKVLVETFGEPRPGDWWIGQQTYGPNKRCPSLRCDVCGEYLYPYGDIAEVVRKEDAEQGTDKHLLVHFDGCFDKERMVMA